MLSNYKLELTEKNFGILQECYEKAKEILNFYNREQILLLMSILLTNNTTI